MATGNCEKTGNPGAMGYHVTQYTRWSVSFQLSNHPSVNMGQRMGETKHQSDERLHGVRCGGVEGLHAHFVHVFTLPIRIFCYL